MVLEGESLRRYFWDVDPDHLDVQSDAPFIMARLLEWGDLDAIRWLLKTYSVGELGVTLKTIRSLSPKSALFWAGLLGLAKEELKCMQKSWNTKSRSAWPY